MVAPVRSVQIRIDVHQPFRPVDQAVAHHPVAPEQHAFRRNVRQDDAGRLRKRRERAELDQAHRPVFRVVGEFDVDGHLHRRLKRRQDPADEPEKMRMLVRKVREGKDRPGSRRQRTSGPVEQVVREDLHERVNGRVPFEDEREELVEPGRHEAAEGPVDVVELGLPGSRDLPGLVSLGPEVGIREIEDAGVRPLDGSRPEAEAEAHHAVLLADARRRTAVHPRECGPRKFRVVQIVAELSRDRLDQDGHGLVLVAAAVLRPVGAGRGFEQGGPDGPQGILDLTHPSFGIADVGGETRIVLPGEGEAHGILERGTRPDGERNAVQQREPAFEVPREAFAEAPLREGDGDPLPVGLPVCPLHIIVADVSEKDPGADDQRDGGKKDRSGERTGRDCAMRESQPFRLASDPSFADQPSSFRVEGRCVVIEKIAAFSRLRHATHPTPRSFRPARGERIREKGVVRVRMPA